jgi:hypothetical protein
MVILKVDLEYVFLFHPQLYGTIMLIYCHNIYTLFYKYGKLISFRRNGYKKESSKQQQ